VKRKRHVNLRPAQWAEVKELYEDGHTSTDLADAYRVHASTVSEHAKSGNWDYSKQPPRVRTLIEYRRGIAAKRQSVLEVNRWVAERLPKDSPRLVLDTDDRLVKETKELPKPYAPKTGSITFTVSGPANGELGLAVFDELLTAARRTYPAGKLTVEIKCEGVKS
jgi:hypothetical protein